MKKFVPLALILLLTGCSSGETAEPRLGMAINGEGEDRSVTVCALTLDDQGRIARVLWDAQEGPDSKRQLGDRYGMKAASPIGREWHQQVAALEEYAAGKTPAQLAGMALNDRGAPTAEELTSSCTISVAPLLEALEVAMEQ